MKRIFDWFVVACSILALALSLYSLGRIHGEGDMRYYLDACKARAADCRDELRVCKESAR